MALVHIVGRWIGTAQLYNVDKQAYVGGITLSEDIALQLSPGAYRLEPSFVEGFENSYVNFDVKDAFKVVTVEWLSVEAISEMAMQAMVNTTYTAGARFDIYVKEGQAFVACTEGVAFPMIDSALVAATGLFDILTTVVAENGMDVTVTFTRPATVVTGELDSVFKLHSATVSDKPMTYVDGDGTNIWRFTVAQPVLADTDWLLVPNSEVLFIQDEFGNGLNLTVDRVVINNSTINMPLLQNASIDVTGAYLTLLLNKNVVINAYKVGDLALSIGATVIYPVYVSGSGTQSLTFSLSPLVVKDAIPVLAYNGRPDGIEDQLDNDLAAFSGMSVINDSEEAYPDIVLWSGFEGTITGTTYEATNNDYPPFHAGSVSPSTLITPTYRVVGSTCLYTASSAYSNIFNMDPMSTRRGRVGFWIRPTGVLTSMGIFMLSNSAVNANWALGLRFVLNSSTVMYIGGRNNGLTFGGEITPPSIVAGTAYFIEVEWDNSVGYINLYVDGVLVGNTAYVSVDASEFNYIFVGRSYLFANGIVAGFDNMMVSSDPNRDLYALALLEACPRI